MGYFLRISRRNEVFRLFAAENIYAHEPPSFESPLTLPWKNKNRLPPKSYRQVKLPPKNYHVLILPFPPKSLPMTSQIPFIAEKLPSIALPPRFEPPNKALPRSTLYNI